MACRFRGENWYTWYSVIVLMACYAVGELGHFLIGIVSRPLAQDVEFGDKACITTNSSLEEKAQLECKEGNATSCSTLVVNGSTYCQWNYSGSGVEYQVLAGPSFIAIFTVMGIIIGVVGDMYNRVRLLTICVAWYSVMCILTGFTTEYWQLILLRFGFGAGEAGVSPLTASIVADKFGARSRALAMSVFNWGIYFGYGLAFAVGNYVTEANILGQAGFLPHISCLVLALVFICAFTVLFSDYLTVSKIVLGVVFELVKETVALLSTTTFSKYFPQKAGWRWAYFVTGMPGVVMSLLLVCTVKEPSRKDVCEKPPEQTQKPDDQEGASHSLLPDPATKSEISKSTNSVFEKLWKAVTMFFTNPAILMLLFAASVRHTASFCWAYNTQLYFDYYYPDYDIGISMMICSIVGGSFGIASGGIISDLVVSKYGISTRLWVLVGSQAIASPLAAMVLYLSPPYCFIALLSAYVFAEMWFGILFTVLVEIFPFSTRSTAIALFIFVMNNVASCGQLLVPTFKPILGFRQTLYLTYVGFYGLTEMWYGVVMTVLVEMVATDVRSTAISLFAFVIGNVGGNLPVIVAPLKGAVGGLRQALYIMYPGFYLLSSFFFLLTQLLISRRKKKGDALQAIDQLSNENNKPPSLVQ